VICCTWRKRIPSRSKTWISCSRSQSVSNLKE
jgi:hypothetical protein